MKTNKIIQELLYTMYKRLSIVILTIAIITLVGCMEVEEGPVIEKHEHHAPTKAVQSYITIFKHTKHGRRILRDLEKYSEINSSSYTPGADSVYLGYREGKKDTYLYIKEMTDHDMELDLEHEE